MKSIKNISYMTLMVFQSVTKDKDIVDVHMYVLPNNILEYESHYSLECSGSITVSLDHNVTDKSTIYINKCSLPYVRRINSNLFECIAHVEF